MSTKTMTTKTTAMGLADATFLIEKLGHECGEAQFLRELTQNAIEAIEATGRANGEIRWDYDEYLLEETGAYKLCITDNGCGMSGAQMERYLNNLSSSSRVQGLDANFGMGAKIAALPRNPEGLVYLSWQCGKGTLAHLWKDPHAGTYGLQQLSLPNDTFGSIGGVSDAQTPDLIGSTGTGTRVVLMGRSPEDNTTRPPAEFANKSEWIQKELNKRYFRFPAGIKVSARTHITQTNGAPGTGKVRRIDGMHAFLSDAASSSYILAVPRRARDAATC